jgi:hypothetical protein
LSNKSTMQSTVRLVPKLPKRAVGRKLHHLLDLGGRQTLLQIKGNEPAMLRPELAYGLCKPLSADGLGTQPVIIRRSG